MHKSAEKNPLLLLIICFLLALCAVFGLLLSSCGLTICTDETLMGADWGVFYFFVVFSIGLCGNIYLLLRWVDDRPKIITMIASNLLWVTGVFALGLGNALALYELPESGFLWGFAALFSLPGVLLAAVGLALYQSNMKANQIWDSEQWKQPATKIHPVTSVLSKLLIGLCLFTLLYDGFVLFRLA